MAYYENLVGHAWSDTWNIVFNTPLLSLLAAIGIFGVSLLIHSYRKGLSEVRDGLIVGLEGAVASCVVFALVFLLHLLIFTPKRLYEAAKAAANQNKPPIAQQEFTINERDPKAREDVAAARAELVETKRSSRRETRSYRN